jgi:hypothetical protein
LIISTFNDKFDHHDRDSPGSLGYEDIEILKPD